MLALLFEKSPSPTALIFAPANSEPATCVVARTVSRRVVPAGISAITQLTDDAFVVQTPPGMLAEVTAWLRLTESTALRTAIERCDFTSA